MWWKGGGLLTTSIIIRIIWNLIKRRLLRRPCEEEGEEKKQTNYCQRHEKKRKRRKERNEEENQTKLKVSLSTKVFDVNGGNKNFGLLKIIMGLGVITYSLPNLLSLLFFIPLKLSHIKLERVFN